MNEQIDWSKAPADATHYHPRAGGYVEHWIKPGFFCVTDFEHEGWQATSADALKMAIPRPLPVAKAWNGPDDGLPPVGLEVEAYFPKDTQPQWLKTTFLYVSDHVVIYTDVFDEIHKSRTEFNKLDVQLRPIRTAEQLAAEERERVAEEMVRRFALHGVDAPWKGLFLQMYDCGVLKP